MPDPSFRNQIVWMDLFVTDLNRAIQFYAAVLGQAIAKETYEQFTFAILPHEGGGNGVCLVPHPVDKPSATGPLVYFNVTGRLDAAVAAVEPSGGKVIEPIKMIGPHGFRAIVLDSEGNRIALHSP